MPRNKNQTIANELQIYAWNGARLDELTDLVQQYCCRQLPVTLEMPVGADGVPRQMSAFGISRSGKLMIELDDGSILVLSEDLLPITSISAAVRDGLGGPITFCPRTKSMFVRSVREDRIVAIDLDGTRRVDLDGLVPNRPDPMLLLAMPTGTMFLLHSHAAAKLTCGDRTVDLFVEHLERAGRLGTIDLAKDRIYVALPTEKRWVVRFYDETLTEWRESITVNYRPLGFDIGHGVFLLPTPRGVIAVDCDGVTKFEVPSRFSVDFVGWFGDDCLLMSWDLTHISIEKAAFMPPVPITRLVL